MKTYFAKYLPVKGEIKEGDWVIHPDGKVRKCIEIIKGDKDFNDFITMTDNTGCYRDKSKKVKLFLCSRNIQVGDKVKSFNYPEQEEREVVNLRTSKKLVGAENHSEIYHLVDIQYPNEINTAAVSNFFKVIGEISPEATWVKEGDRFDKTEIKWTPWGKEFDWEVLNSNGELPYPNATISIKGPCGHFH